MIDASSPFSLDEFISRFQLQQPQHTPLSFSARHAAVLIPIVNHERPTLLLTRRSSTLRKHAGQVAFPGGSADDSDSGPIMTALREAREEVGIPPECVRILGCLPSVDSSSGYQVTPVVGIIPERTVFSINQEEVAELFEMPLQEALTLSRYHPLRIHRAGKHHLVYLSWYQRQFVWGLTATIIRRLAFHVG